MSDLYNDCKGDNGSVVIPKGWFGDVSDKYRLGNIPIIERDKINPDHYQDGGIQTIDFIEAKKLNFCLGNAVKYISRAGKKSKETYKEDLERAIWYLQRELKRY